MRAMVYSLAVVWWVLATSSALQAEAAFFYAQGPDGGWSTGVAWDRATRSQAQEDAHVRCLENQPYDGTCELVTAFNNSCFAIAVSSNAYGWAQGATLSIAKKRAKGQCENRGADCVIQDAFCDTLKEVARTLICVRPLFEIERELRDKINGSSVRTREVADAINYLHTEFCRVTEDELAEGNRQIISDNCYQVSGEYRGETVYWGECLD